MAVKVAVLVPGIMGSVLYRDQSGERREIWSADFGENYERLLDEPGLLRWNCNPAKAELLDVVYVGTIPFFSRSIRLRRKRRIFALWEALRQYLATHSDFRKKNQILPYAYDWRQSLLDTARDLGQRLSRDVDRLAQDEGVAPETVSCVFFTHSMGGLVLRLALALGTVNPAAVKTIVHIGSPLRGAPRAFRSAYSDVELPWLRMLVSAYKGKDDEAFYRHLHDVLQGFPSLYQLMPHVERAYLTFDGSSDFNPFGEDSRIEEDMRQLACSTQECLDDAEQIISREGIEVFTIFGTRNSKDLTDVRYLVQERGRPRQGYDIEHIWSFEKGDGTVPAWSAQGGSDCRPNGLRDLEHMLMCNNEDVVAAIANSMV